ncbi:1264_t:CDS:2, partial [Gigaspora rosea]
NIKEKVGVMKTGCKVVFAPQIEQVAENTLKKIFEDIGSILTSDLLRKREPKFSIIANYHGITCAQWPGRLQWVDVLKSQVQVDGAHNPSAAKALRNYVHEQLQLQNKEIIKICNAC